MRSELALKQLDKVIGLARVEMYKPIQIAETLREFRLKKSFDPASLETYRNLSRELRNRVTLELIGKVSTSSMRYQDDVWNASALPPESLSALAKINRNHEIEEYIYQHVYAKSLQMIKIRKLLDQIENVKEVASIFESFDTPGLRSSADRLFEVFALAVLQTQIEKSDFTFTLAGNAESISGQTGKKLISIAEGQGNDLELAKMGHTNAADAGLDIWTNFGVVISVKNYTLDIDLFQKVLTDTPVGLLVIICESTTSLLEKELKKIALERQVVVITSQELFADAELLLINANQSGLFVDKLISFYDKEFPLAVTLETFMMKRNYKVSLPKTLAIHASS
jgi:type II restriction enzyme